MDKPDVTNDQHTDNFKLKAGLFLTFVSGISALIGFNVTLATARKQEAKYFDKAVIDTTELNIAGARLALRALGWGTLYAVCGTGILTYGIWKFSGAKDMKDFRYKMGTILPKLTKESSNERTEFSGLTDLLDYLQKQK